MGGLLALENATGIYAALTIGITKIAAVAHHPAGFGIFARRKCRGKPMANRRVGKMHTPGDEEGAAGDVNCVGPFACKSCEGRIDLSDARRLVKLDLQSYSARGAFQISVGAGCIRIVWIVEHGDAYRRGHKLMQEL